MPDGAPRRQVAKARRRARRLVLAFLGVKSWVSSYRVITPEVRAWARRFTKDLRRSRLLFDAVEFEVFPDRMPEVMTRPVSIVGRQVICLALDDVDGLS